MEDPDRPGDHACPHTLVTSIPDGIHKHKHTHNVNRWIEAKGQPLNQAVETIDNVIRKQDSNPRNRGRVPQSTAEPARLIASAISTHRPY